MFIFPDSIQKFLFKSLPIRGSIVRLDKTFADMMQRRAYPSEIRDLLGQAILTSVLLTGTIKFDGYLILQFQSEDIIKLLVSRCTSDFNVRSLIQYDQVKFAELNNKKNLLNTGQLVVTFCQDAVVKPHQSIIPLSAQGLITSVEYYFAQSEQITTKLWLNITEQQEIYGMILQLMPDQDTQSREKFWAYANNVNDIFQSAAFQDVPNEVLLTQWFPQEDIECFNVQAVKAQCHCSIERMKNAVLTLGEAEARDILKTNRYIVVTCEFCDNNFSFDEAAINQIFAVMRN